MSDNVEDNSPQGIYTFFQEDAIECAASYPEEIEEALCLWVNTKSAQAQDGERDKMCRPEEILLDTMKFYANKNHWMGQAEDGPECLLVATGKSIFPEGWAEAHGALQAYAIAKFATPDVKVVTDEMITAFAVGSEMGNGNFDSSDPTMRQILERTKSRIKNGLTSALLANSLKTK